MSCYSFSYSREVEESFSWCHDRGSAQVKGTHFRIKGQWWEQLATALCEFKCDTALSTERRTWRRHTGSAHRSEDISKGRPIPSVTSSYANHTYFFFLISNFVPFPQTLSCRLHDARWQVRVAATDVTTRWKGERELGWCRWRVLVEKDSLAVSKWQKKNKTEMKKQICKKNQTKKTKKPKQKQKTQHFVWLFFPIN